MGIRRHFRSTLITGILTLIPLGVTVFVLKFLFTTIDGWLKPIMSPILSEILDEKISHRYGGPSDDPARLPSGASCL